MYMTILNMILVTFTCYNILSILPNNTPEYIVAFIIMIHILIFISCSYYKEEKPNTDNDIDYRITKRMNVGGINIVEYKSNISNKKHYMREEDFVSSYEVNN
jgi:hypothetical protein